MSDKMKEYHNSNNKPENPAAFPIATSHPYQGGMSLRDYFAGEAMHIVGGDYCDEALAQRCYYMADLMLKVREK